MITYIIPLEPVAATRPRVSRYSTYHTPKYQAFLKEIRAYSFDSIHKEPVHIEIDLYCRKPKHSKLEYPRSDIDNYVKAVLDGVQPELILDDKQIVSLTASKQFVNGPGYIEVSIESIL